MTMKTRVAFWIAAAVMFVYLLTACGVWKPAYQPVGGGSWELNPRFK